MDRCIGVVNTGRLVELTIVLDKATDMRVKPLVLVEIPSEGVKSEDYTILKDHGLGFELKGGGFAFLDGVDCDFNFHSLYNGSPSLK